MIELADKDYKTVAFKYVQACEGGINIMRE